MNLHTWRRASWLLGILLAMFAVVFALQSHLARAQANPLQPGEVVVESNGEIRYALADGTQMTASGWITDEIGFASEFTTDSTELMQTELVSRGYELLVTNRTVTRTLGHGDELFLFTQYVDGENRGWDIILRPQITQTIVMRIALDIESTIQLYGGNMTCQWLTGLVQCTGVTGPHDPIHVFQNKWRPGSPTCSSMVIQTWPTTSGNNAAYDTARVNRCGNVYAPIIANN